MGFSAAGGGSFSTDPKMNVTPLIDVLLVLIIVFMLVVVEQRPTWAGGADSSALQS